MPQGIREAKHNPISLHTANSYITPGRRCQTRWGGSAKHPIALVADCDASRDALSNCGATHNLNQDRGPVVRVLMVRASTRVEVCPTPSRVATTRSTASRFGFGRRSVTYPKRRLVQRQDRQSGAPTANFPTGDSCGYEEHFDAYTFVFNLTFCARWFFLPVLGGRIPISWFSGRLGW